MRNITVKRFFINASAEKQFKDIAIAVEPDAMEILTAAVCAKYPTDLGAYCIDMDSQVIVHKFHWDAAADPPVAVKDW